MELRQPLIPIVILNSNGLEVTEECLQALKIQTYQNFEIHLVDNGSLKAEKKVWQIFRLEFLFRSAITQVRLFLRNLLIPKTRPFCSGYPISFALYWESLCFQNLTTLIAKTLYCCTNQLKLSHFIKKLFFVINFL